MKNDTFDDVRYFLLGLQVANTADIFVDLSKPQSSETQTPETPNDGGDSDDK